jgi:hypothetical protein
MQVETFAHPQQELMALGSGLPTIFQNREDVRPDGLRLP